MTPPIKRKNKGHTNGDKTHIFFLNVFDIDCVVIIGKLLIN